MKDKIDNKDQEKDLTNEENDEVDAYIDMFKEQGKAEQIRKDLNDLRLRVLKEDVRNLRKLNHTTYKTMAKTHEHHSDFLHAHNIENIARSTFILTLQTRISELEKELREARKEIKESEAGK